MFIFLDQEMVLMSSKNEALDFFAIKNMFLASCRQIYLDDQLFDTNFL